MKLDRNINGDGRGKYGLVNNRELREYAKRAADAHAGRNAMMTEADIEAMRVMNAVKMLEDFGIIDWGLEGTESEFFVIKLRDWHAEAALAEYARSALDNGDEEYYLDVRALSDRAGRHSPFCKKPD